MINYGKISKIVFFLLFFYLLTLVNLPVANAMTGSGTVADPFIITSRSDLEAIKNNLTASYKLANDIDLSGIIWTPITGFKGNLDGNGYCIKNLTSTTRGLFYSVTGTSSIHATINNLILTIKSINTSLSTVGGLVGSGSYLDISGVAVLNADSGSGINSSIKYIGGILGKAGSCTDITDSYAILPVTGSSDVGGLIGYFSGTSSPTITRCYFAGTVTGSSDVYGLAESATLTNSYYDGVVAGIDPVNKTQMKLTTGMTYQENFIDWDFINIWEIDQGSSYPYLRNLEKPVNVTSINISDVPSWAGTSADPYVITTAQQLNNIRYDIYAFYKLGSDIDLGSTTWTSIPYFHGNLDGNGYSIKNLTSATKGLFDSVTGTSSAHASINNLTLMIKSVNTSSGTVGGLVGSGSYLDISKVAVLNADSGTGISSSGSNIGGILGSAGSSTTITDSYAILPVTGSSTVGGLLGNTSTVAKPSPTITRCYFAGTVTGSSDVYGLARSATFTSSYYDSTVAGISTGTGAKTTEEMKQQATFTGWDFINTWNIDEGVTYPYLWSGTTSGTNPYVLTNAQELSDIRNDIYASYKLGNDIDLDGTTWIPISHFHGNLDGNGYGIKNLTSTTKGLFDSVTGTSKNHATINNLTLTIKSINTGSGNVGGLVGSGSFLDISGVAVLNADGGTGINSSNAYIGGIIGSAGSYIAIADSYAILPVNGSKTVGGLIGHYSGDKSPTITRCYFAGTITGSSGVYGLAASGTLTNSYYDGVVAGIDPANKIQMKLTTGMTHQENYNQEKYTGWDFTNTWAIDEGSSYPYLRNLQKPVNVTSINISDVPFGAGTSADPYVITTAQQLNNIRYDIYAFYKLGSDIDLGGTTWTPVPYFHGNFDGNGYGVKNLTSVTNGLFDEVTGTSSAHASINNLTLSIKSLDTNLSIVGGLVGSGSFLDISGVAVLNADGGTGINSSNAYIGGIIGSAGSYIAIADSYAILPVNGSKTVGGLIGHYSGDKSPTITRCYFAGTVAGSSGVYGLAASGTLTNCYYDGVVAGIDPANKIQMKLTTGMTHQENYNQEKYTGWDFTNTWAIDEGSSYATPRPTITRCYFAGTVAGSSGVYGLARSATFTSSYYDSTVAGISTGTGAKTTEDMKQQATFTGWDFVHVWNIDEGVTYPYLFLRTEETGTNPYLKATYGEARYCAKAGEPVNLSTGNFILEETDVKIPTRGNPLEFTRFYNSLDQNTGSLGKGWTHNYNTKLTFNEDSSIAVSYADGHVLYFENSGTGYVTPPGYNETLTVGPDNTYILTFKDKSGYTFNSAGQLISIADKNGSAITLSYTDGLLASAADPTGRSLTFTYDSSGRISDITDPVGRMVTYTYDTGGNLATVQDVRGGITRYTYNQYGLTDITEPNGNTFLHNQYDSQGRVISQTDGSGNVSTFDYDTVNRRTTLTDPAGNEIINVFDERYRTTEIIYPGNVTEIRTYGENGLIAAKTDKNGNTTSYTYDSRGNTTTFTYDESGNLLTVTDPLGNVTTMAYDANDNLTGVSDPDGNTTGYEYNANNKLTRVTDPLGNITTYEYDVNRNLKLRTDPNGHVITYGYDFLGRLTSGTYPDGATESLTLDGIGNLTAKTDLRGSTTNYEYDSVNRLTKITDPEGGTATTQYDPLGNVTVITDPRGNTTTFAYDSLSRLLSATDPLGHTTCYTYDSAGNKTSATNARGATWNYAYDAVGRLLSVTDPFGNITSNRYDSVGNAVYATNANGVSTYFDYDPLNRLEKVTDALGNITRYAYDKKGNMVTAINAAGHTTAYTYDALNRLLEETNPLGQARSLAYDPAGNIIARTKPDGTEIKYDYDVNDRLVGITYPDNTGVTYAYDTGGNRISITDPHGATSYSRDSLGRITSVDRNGNTIGYRYDPAGNKTGLTYPDGMVINYGYNELNQPVSVTGAVYGTTIAYDELGNRVEEILPNGVTVNYNYDDAGRLTSLWHGRGGETLTGVEYTYDKLGNRTSATDEKGNTTGYTYDAINQLIGVRYPDGNTVDYAYDSVGNRKTSGGVSYIYDADNRLTMAGGVPYNYDANGNMLSVGDAVYCRYDYEDRLVQYSGPSGSFGYTYDGDGNRTGMSVSGSVYGTTEYIYDINAGLPLLLVEKDNSGNQSNYIYAGRLLSRIGPEGEHFYHQDGLGSISVISDVYGNPLNRYTYDVFGNLLSSNESVNTIYSALPVSHGTPAGLYSSGPGIMTL